VPGSIRALQNNYQPLADALAAAVPQWQYRPAILDGQPVRQLVKERKTVTSLVVVTRSGSSAPSRPPNSARSCR